MGKGWVCCSTKIKCPKDAQTVSDKKVFEIAWRLRISHFEKTSEVSSELINFSQGLLVEVLLEKVGTVHKT